MIWCLENNLFLSFFLLWHCDVVTPRRRLRRNLLLRSKRAHISMATSFFVANLRDPYGFFLEWLKLERHDNTERTDGLSSRHTIRRMWPKHRAVIYNYMRSSRNNQLKRTTTTDSYLLLGVCDFIVPKKKINVKVKCAFYREFIATFVLFAR